jgi:pimeloyl-ACP methyl ester carboxylesterase
MLPPCSSALLGHRARFHIEGSGRPVVLLHGASELWHRLVERLFRSHRVIAVDLGQQRELPWIDSVLRIGLLPGERFHLVGHSEGMAAALRIANARPQRLHSLTLCAPVRPDDLRRITAPTQQLSGRDELASAIDGFIRAVDALELQCGTRVALHD